MNIPVKKLLLKMEEELLLAKQTSSEAVIREKAYSIRTLCDLIIDEPVSARPPSPGSPQQVIRPVAPMAQPKKLAEDEANGDSIFDF